MVHAKRDEKSWEDSTLEPIAIVGMSCHLPGQVRSPSALWELLKAKGSVQTPRVPDNRFNIDAHFHKNLERPGSFNVLGGYFLDGALEDFDPTFFNITPIEAMWMDPQQRKIIEVAYECLESGGLTLDAVAGSNTAVFIGSFTSDYQQMSIRDTDFRHNYAATGVDPGIISNRIGNIFNLRGPSFTINTACSSSVYAIHNACHALRARDCEAALAGGVNLIMTVDQHMNTAKLGILSPTSTCHTFDASADGYGRAEGAGALYLKRLSDAIRDGDPIRGVIRSSFVNTNGKVDGMGITHPSVEGQSRVLRSAYKRANLDPVKTAYAECHGTGTPVGDPIEVRAIAKAMNDTRSPDRPLLVGAIKANIGHSEAASGIFAVMKAALMTEAGVIPGVSGLKQLNPNIHEKDWNVKVNVDTIPWPSDFAVRRASVSSFGYGGTNGHVIVEAVESLYPWYQHGKPKSIAAYDNSASRPFLLTFSAHDKATLARNIDAHAKVAEDFYLADLAYTLNTRRSKFSQRAYTVAYEGRTAEAFETEKVKSGTAPGVAPEVGFIFTGQGAQWAGMGVEALHAFPSFLKTIRALDRVLQRLDPAPQWKLEEVLVAPKENSKMSEAEIAQPICTAIQIAIVDLLEEWGISPTVTVGHSSGEIGAGYAAGMISAPEAIIAAFYRGLAVKQAAPSGSMLAVGLGASEAAPFISTLKDDVVIACENSPSSVTLSGSAAGIQAAKEIFDSEKIFARELRTGRAYHSQHMNAVAPLYEKLLLLAYKSIDKNDLSWRQPRSRMISSVTGQEILGNDIPFQYWSENLRNRVLFDTAVTTLAQIPDFANVGCMVEIGPHSALAGPFKQICIANKFTQFKYVPSLVRNVDGAVSLLNTAGELTLSNYPVDLERVNDIEESSHAIPLQKRRKPLVLVDLPTYQWNYEKRFWAEPRFSTEQRLLQHDRHDVLGRKVVGLSERSPVWKNQLRHRDIPWLKDHSLGDAAVFPAAGHLSMAIEALRQISEGDGIQIDSVTIRDIAIKTALVIPETDNGIEVQFRMQLLSNSDYTNSTPWYGFAVESITDNVWTTHCQGRIAGNYVSQPSKELKSPVELSKLTQRVPGKRWYDAFHRVGFQYTGAFQPLQHIRTNGKDRHAFATLKVNTDSGVMVDESRYLLHPATIDACLQLIIISINSGLHKEMPWGVVPLEMEEITLWAPGSDAGGDGAAVAWTDNHEGRYFNTHTKLQTQSGQVVLDVKNLRCVAYEAAVPQTAVEPRAPEPYMKVAWEPTEIQLENKLNGHGPATGLLSIVSLKPENDDVKQLTSLLDGSGISASSSALTDTDLANATKFLIYDSDGTLLLEASKNPAVFESLRKILIHHLPIIWLTSGVNQGCNAFGGMSQGFLRAIRSEQAAAKISLLDVDNKTSPESIAKLLPDLFETAGTKDSGVDTEFWLQGDVLHVPRIVPNEHLNVRFSDHSDAAADTTLSNGQYLEGKIQDDALVFQVSKAEATLNSDEIEIQVAAAENKAKSPFVIGTVTRSGVSATAAQSGQTVIALAETPYTTIVKALDNAVVTLPDGLQGPEILTNFRVLSSALNAVSLVGKAQKGDQVLLANTSQSFVEAAIQLSSVLEFQLTVVADDEKSKDDISTKYPSFGGSILLVKELEKLQSLFTASNGSQTPFVAVVETFSDFVQDLWRLLPSGSRLILNDGSFTQTPDASPFLKGASLIATGLETIRKQNSTSTGSIATVLRASLDIIEKNPSLIHKAPILLDIGSPSAALPQDGSVLVYNYGKSIVKTLPEVKTLEFSPDAAYILVGCLGGLGRSLTTFMRSRGCSNFVFISRSGADKPDAALVVKDLIASGATVHVYRGDASNEADVANVIADVKKNYTIRGVVHAAMVLQDGMFESLSHERFRAAIDPKVLGALNLHTALYDVPLDFFVMTSSISAVLGNPGQTNYSAANSYLDFLATHRNNNGLAATSLALPMVLDVGVVSENEAIELSLLRKGMYGIDEREMLKSFEAAMSVPNPATTEAHKNSPQIVLGLDPTLLAGAVSSKDAVDPYWYNDARLQKIRAAVEDILEDSVSSGRGGGDFMSSLAGLAGESDALKLQVIAEHLMQKCSSILMLSVDDFQVDGRGIGSYGLDSMIGAEFRNWLFKEFGLEIGFQTLLAPTMTFKALAQTIATKLGLIEAAE